MILALIMMYLFLLEMVERELTNFEVAAFTGKLKTYLIMNNVETRK